MQRDGESPIATVSRCCLPPFGIRFCPLDVYLFSTSELDTRSRTKLDKCKHMEKGSACFRQKPPKSGFIYLLLILQSPCQLYEDKTLNVCTQLNYTNLADPLLTLRGLCQSRRSGQNLPFYFCIANQMPRFVVL